MATKTIRGKCPNCCPDGGACFTIELDWDAIDRGEDTNRKVKRCNNCHHTLPFRRIKATGKPTTSQQRILDQVMDVFGGTIEKQEMIGRKLFFTATNPAKSMWTGNSLFGTIGVGGSFKITLQRIGGDAKITDNIGISVYLR